MQTKLGFLQSSANTRMHFVVFLGDGPPIKAVEPLVFIAALALAELLTYMWHATIGCWFHGVLLAYVVFRGSTHPDSVIGQFLLDLSPCMLVRLVSLAISPNLFPGIWYYTLTEGILLVAVILCISVNRYSLAEIGLTFGRRIWITPFVFLTGLLAGGLEPRIFTPESLSTNLTWSQIWIPSVLLMVFTGFTEELLFRGVIQQSANRIYKPWFSVILSSTLFSILHLGWLPIEGILFVFSIGILWGAFRHISQSIIALSLSHGLANILLFLVLPNLLK